MSTPNKPRVVTAFEKLDKAIQQQIKLEYPEGFSQHLIKFTNREGEIVSALRYESEEKIYLVKMSVMLAEQLIEDDELQSWFSYYQFTKKELDTLQTGNFTNLALQID